LQTKQLEDQVSIMEMQKAQIEQRQDEQIIEAYLSWKTNKGKMIVSEQTIIKQTVYQELYRQATQGEILGMAKELDVLQQSQKDFEDKSVDMAKQLANYTQQKIILEKQVANYNNAVALANSSLKDMRGKSSNVQQKIDQLSQEQADVKNADDQITNNGTNGGTKEIVAGQFYFYGTGRDAKQGHGVGMSQWGAYGAANSGWSAEKIVTFYYANTKVLPGSSVGYSNPTINVEGVGVMGLEDYVAGIGEIPDKACGTSEQIIAWSKYSDERGWSASDPRRNKFAIDNKSTVWDCWPEESIKAQVLAARSYGITSTQPICRTANCQVYKGGQGKAWAAYETNNMYIVSVGSTSNGRVIRALYSADNSQGFGTANNDTIFSDKYGNGTAYSYLRAANDSVFAAKTGYTNWAWRTNGYSMEQVDNMLTYAANNYTTGGTSTFLKGIRSSIGKLQSVSLIRDPSQRVKQVKLVGSNGEKIMAGWLFKAIWNDWVFEVRPTQQEDYIYSLTYGFMQK